MESVRDGNEKEPVVVERARRSRKKRPFGDRRWKRNQKRLSGYQHFLRACLDELKVRYPDSSIVLSAVSKLCAENWQNLSEDLKKRFQDEADAINISNGQGQPIPKVSKRLGYAPKRPLSAFILFCKDNRHTVKRANPEMTMAQVSSVMSVHWRDADRETRLKYQRLSAKQRERYRKEVRESKDSESTEDEEEDAAGEAVEASSQD